MAGAGFRSRYREVSLLAILLAIGAGGLVVYELRGAEFRFGKEERAFLAYFENSNPTKAYWERHQILAKLRIECDFYDIERWRHGHATDSPRPAIDPSCYTPRPGTSKSVLIWGDSHAQHLNYGLAHALDAKLSLLQVASSGCPARIVHDVDDHHYCNKSNRFAMDVISRVKPDVVVIAQLGGHDLMVFRETAQALHQVGVKRVLIMGPVPQWWADLHRIVFREHHLHAPARIASDPGPLETNNQLIRGLRRQEPFELVDLMGFFCNRDGCITTLGGDAPQALVTADYGHLTPATSLYLARNLLKPLIEEPD